MYSNCLCCRGTTGHVKSKDLRGNQRQASLENVKNTNSPYQISEDDELGEQLEMARNAALSASSSLTFTFSLLVKVEVLIAGAVSGESILAAAFIIGFLGNQKRHGRSYGNGVSMLLVK
ncbi:hypothetical protein ACOSQ4_018052 [Xanthoceras sorbifolium]